MSDKPQNMILASNSPRRREILTQGGFSFTVDAADIDEDLGIDDPAKLVEELSYNKARAVADRHPGDIIIGADTVVVIENDILGKPSDEADAANMLRCLSGATHQVMTGVSLICGKKRITFHEVTDVTFFELTDEEIKDYVNTGEPLDKAGAYGIQGRGALLVESIKGDYLNVVGLPLARLNQYLHNMPNECQA